MENNDLEKQILDRYTNNLEYLKKHDNSLYAKLNLFNLALELGEIKERYILQYKDSYFDVYDNVENSFIYNTNSKNYSREIVSEVDYKSKENSFKTFYEYKYEDDVAEESKKASIESNSIFGNAPVVHYINKQLPKEEKFKTIYNYIVFGVALGIHLEELKLKVNAKIYNIIEPSLELFRLSLFVTDYSKVFENTQVKFYIAENESEFTEKFKFLYFKTFFYNHYIKFFIFSQNCSLYINYIQNILVSQSQYIYSYDRQIKSLNRTYNYIKEKYNYIDISRNHDFEYIQNKPVLLLAAGPSLKNHIAFIKQNKDKFIIVAIYSLLPFLEENEILPDIVTQYDEADEPIMNTIKKINNLTFFKNTIFLFSSHLDPKVMATFNKSNMYIFQAMFEVKKDFHTLTSPSIGEITYALLNILGFRIIYLLGLDMALDPDTNQTHFEENYVGSFSTKTIEKSCEKKLEENHSFRNSYIKVKGNFVSEVNTLSVYKISIMHMNIFTKKYKELLNTKVYNLSNGAFFEDIEPLEINDINIDDFKIIDKQNSNTNIKEFFNSISEDFISEKDFDYNELKLNDAIKFKEKLLNFKNVKNSNIDNFKNSLHLLHEELCKNYECKDLQRILSNYYNNNIHYIFYLLNLQNISNPKKHIKELQKLFYSQLNKIVEEYIRIISDIK